MEFLRDEGGRAIPSSDARFGLLLGVFAIGTRLAPPFPAFSPSEGNGNGSRLDRRLVFSTRKGPIFDRLRPFLLFEPGTRNVFEARLSGLSSPIWDLELDEALVVDSDKNDI